MPVIEKFKTFEFKASPSKINELINLNNPNKWFGSGKIEIIYQSCTNYKWKYVVGVYNNIYLTKKMNFEFEKNLKKLKIKYKKYCQLGIYGFTTTGDDTILQYLIRRIMILFALNNIKILSYNLIDSNPLVNVRPKPYPLIGLYNTIPSSDRILGVMLLYKVNKLGLANELLITNDLDNLSIDTIETNKMTLFNQQIQTIINNRTIVDENQIADNELITLIRGLLVQILTPNPTAPNPL